MDVFTARLPTRSVQQSKTAPVLFIYREPENPNRYKITLEFGILMKGTTNTSASQRTQVRCIDGSYLMIYAYKTQNIASCKTLNKLIKDSGVMPIG